MDKITIKTLKTKVEIVLEKFPSTRNSDVDLVIRVWKVFHPEHISEGYISLSSLFELPREDTIKRIRAAIQNKDGRFLPTDWNVAKKRGINETVWRQSMAANVQSTLYDR